MILTGFWIVRPSKRLFVTTVVLEGIFISATVLPSGIVGAVLVWLLHDPIGAAIWGPMNAWYMHRYARPDCRAADVATIMAMSTLGMTIGPIIAGCLAEYGGPLPPFISNAIDLPFLVSGFIVAVSAILAGFLPKADRG
jgi:MFS family permease